MHRSSSSSRVSNELFINSSSPSQSQSSNQQSSQTVPLNLQQLPTCNPLSHAAKKERIKGLKIACKIKSLRLFGARNFLLQNWSWRTSIPHKTTGVHNL
ncbi:uncharacterized protein LOC111315189 isoform X2 [Durio zibethinus]|uniref:Uncharacterized protein LOC111315189 isoform X2 n=1 Tax=Durio zibethinus TaxID=66656 RepID=A0A6P6B648_DURZI|nr:uncharacterized protein LOC111315189 isoform X2 [Durio zibethinus]